jgi:hypothetical protein
MTIDDLQLLREFRAEIPAPDEETRWRIYTDATSRPAAGPRGRRWRVPSFALAAAVAAAIVAVLLVSPWSGSSDGLVQRALAAVGTGPVLHVITEDSTNTTYVNLKTGRETGGTSREETWIDRQDDRYQILSTQGGRFLSDLLGTYHSRPASQSSAAFSAAALVDFYLALTTGAHTVVVGRGTFNGHEIYWLRSRPSSEAPGEIGVDAHTYKPVLLRFNAPPGPYYYERILLAKATAYSPADFKRRGPIPNRMLRPVAEDIGGFTLGRTSPSTPHGTVVRTPWLSAGTTAAGLRLRAVRPFTFRKENNGAPKPTVHGLELVYGPLSHSQATTLPSRINVFGPRSHPRARTRSTTIYEFQRVRFGPSIAWSHVPADSIEIQTGLTTVGNHVVPTPWIGYMRKHGLYITIGTPQGQPTAVQIARSLNPGRK